jgi:hypothetical protein
MALLYINTLLILRSEVHHCCQTFFGLYTYCEPLLFLLNSIIGTVLLLIVVNMEHVYNTDVINFKRYSRS